MSEERRFDLGEPVILWEPPCWAVYRVPVIGPADPRPLGRFEFRADAFARGDLGRRWGQQIERTAAGSDPRLEAGEGIGEATVRRLEVALRGLVARRPPSRGDLDAVFGPGRGAPAIGDFPRPKIEEVLRSDPSGAEVYVIRGAGSHSHLRIHTPAGPGEAPPAPFWWHRQFLSRVRGPDLAAWFRWLVGSLPRSRRPEGRRLDAWLPRIESAGAALAEMQRGEIAPGHSPEIVVVVGPEGAVNHHPTRYFGRDGALNLERRGDTLVLHGFRRADGTHLDCTVFAMVRADGPGSARDMEGDICAGRRRLLGLGKDIRAVLYVDDVLAIGAGDLCDRDAASFAARCGRGPLAPVPPADIRAPRGVRLWYS